MQFCGYSSVFSPTPILPKLKASSTSCSTPFSHFRKPNEEEKCFSSNKLLSAPFEVQPVAELRTNTVLWTDSRVERTSSAEWGCSGLELLGVLQWLPFSCLTWGWLLGYNAGEEKRQREAQACHMWHLVISGVFAGGVGKRFSVWKL